MKKPTSDSTANRDINRTVKSHNRGCYARLVIKSKICERLHPCETYASVIIGQKSRIEHSQSYVSLKLTKNQNVTYDLMSPEIDCIKFS